MLRRNLLRFLPVVLMGNFSQTAMAQGESPYPSHPVRFIVPIGPGSSGDTLTRALAERFKNLTGQSTFVENKPGADLILGTQNLLNAPADGYSIALISASTVIINPQIINNLPYKVEDLKPVLGLTRHVSVFVTSPNARFKSFTEALKIGKQSPESISIGTYGNTYRLGVLELTRQTGVQFNDIPYKGASQLLTDVVGGATDIGVLDIAAATPLVKSGKLRALAIGGDTRHPFLPDVPTIQENGYPNYSLYVFVGYAISAKTPAPVALRIEELLQKIVNDQDFRAQVIQQSGGEITGLNSDQLKQMIATESVRLRQLNLKKTDYAEKK